MPLDKNRIKALLFDFDGTLCDTDQVLVRKVAKLLCRMPYFLRGGDAMQAARQFVMASETPVNRAYRYLDVTGMDVHAAKIGPLLKPFGTVVGQLMRFVRKEREKKLPHPIEEGVDLMLGALHERYPMALISTSGRPRVEAFLEHYGFSPYFDVVVTAQSTAYMKPHPQPLLHAAEHLGVDPAHCVMIGDTTVDIQAGNNAGTQTVGVLCGFGREHELRRYGANLILKTTSEVAGILIETPELKGG